MGQGDIAIHVSTLITPGSDTHRLSFEAQIPSTNGPKATSRACAGCYCVCSPKGWPCRWDAHPRPCSMPREWLLAGFFTLWTQRGRLRNFISRVWTWRPLLTEKDSSVHLWFRKDYSVLKLPLGPHWVSGFLLVNNLMAINCILGNSDLLQEVISVLLKWNFWSPSVLRLTDLYCDSIYLKHVDHVFDIISN